MRGAGGDDLPGDRIGGAHGHDERAGGVAREEELALYGLRELAEEKLIALIPVGDDGEGGLVLLGAGEERAADDRGVDAAGVVAVARGQHALGEVLLQDDVHHAGDGVGAVDGRGAVLQHLDALDRGDGNHVHVDELLGAEARGAAALAERRERHAPAVEEDERGIDAEPAHRDAGRAGRGGVDAILREALRADLGDLAEEIGQVRLAGGLDFRGREHAEIGGADGLAGAEVGAGDRKRIERDRLANGRRLRAEERGRSRGDKGEEDCGGSHLHGSVKENGRYKTTSAPPQAPR